MAGSDGQIADCGNGIFVGNFESCDRHPPGTLCDRVLHVWHERQPGWCKTCIESPCDAAVLFYLEHDPLTPEILGKVKAAAEAPGRLLIHCAAGMGRSTTLAWYALVVRGVDPFQALAEVARATWTQYQTPIMPCWDCHRLMEIMRATGR